MACSNVRKEYVSLSKLELFGPISLTGCPKRKVNGLIDGEDDIFGTNCFDGKFKGCRESTNVKEKVGEVIWKVC